MKKIHCTKCGDERIIRLFRKRGNGRRSWCVYCERKTNKENMRKKRVAKRVAIRLSDA